MGMSAGGHKGGVSSEINVTPLIDVLLVLLIIFLVVMPIMMKKESLTIPRKLDDQLEDADPNMVMIQLKLRLTNDVEYTDNASPEPVAIPYNDVPKVLRDKLKAVKEGQEKVVFVDFQNGVPWERCVDLMDKIRGLATDANKDEIRVALTVCDTDKRKDGNGNAKTPGSLCPKPE
jgi:biopolymer transport protein ExbD